MKRSQLVRIAAGILVSGAIMPLTGVAHAARPAVPATRTVIYAGTDTGIYRSANGGASWQEVESVDNGGPRARYISLQTADMNTVYAGTDSNGVYRSVDGGRSWQDDNGGNSDLANDTVVGLAVDHNSGAIVAAGGANTVYVSYSGGANWSEYQVGTSSQLNTLAADPVHSGRLLVGTQSDGIYISTDAGADWSAAYGIPANEQVYDIAFNPQNTDVAYAATDDGLYQTIDGGNDWVPERRGIPVGTVISAVAVDPQQGATVVAGTNDGQFYRSTDGGTTWQNVDSTGTDYRLVALIFDPVNPQRVFAGAADDNGFYSSSDNGQSWLPTANPVGGLVDCLAVTSRPALPTAAVPPIANTSFAHYFSQSHHIVSGPFLSFYNKYGGLQVFGLPLTEEFVENGQLVQYFERMRLALVGSRVQVSPLGEQVTSGRYFPPVTPFASTATHLYFAATSHALSGRFLSFWRAHHGALLLGAPISQPLYEQNGDGTGRTYLVQYFQNARLEFHPELSGSSYEITLGLLGQQVLKQRGWL